jgi:type IX secretion system PorP/SprF family membrane protein
MIRILIITIYSLFIAALVNAQDPNFTLFYNNPAYYNPAMTAINRGFTFRLNVRNQWAPIPGKFNTTSATFEGEVLNKLGVGFNLLSDVAGEGFLRTTGGTMSYSYCPIETANHKFQFGMSGGILSRYVDWSRLNFSDQYDEVLGKIYPTNFIPPTFNTTTYMDLGTGAAYQFYYDSKTTKQFKKILINVGGAMQHLNRPKDAFFAENKYIPIKTVIHAKTQILFGILVYSFAGIYETQNKFSTRTIGFNLQHKSSLNIGIWSRSGNTINNQRFESYITSIGYLLPVKTVHKLRFTYSVDFTMTQLRTSSFGSHEISLVFMMDDKYMLKGFEAKRKRKDMFKCPEDFKGFN